MEGNSVVGSKKMDWYLRLGLLLASLEKGFDPLKICGTINTKMKFEDGSELCCFPINVLHCCYISERKDVSSVRHGLLVLKPCTCYLASRDDVSRLPLARCSTIKDTQSVGERFTECTEKFTSSDDNKKRKLNVKQRGEGELSSSSLSKVKSFLEDDAYQQNRTVPEMYSFCTFGPLQNICTGIVNV